MEAIRIDVYKFLYSVGLLQESRELALLSLKIRVTTNVFLVDEDVGYRALFCHVLESVLDGRTIIYTQESASCLLYLTLIE